MRNKLPIGLAGAVVIASALVGYAVHRSGAGLPQEPARATNSPSADPTDAKSRTATDGVSDRGGVPPRAITLAGDPELGPDSLRPGFQEIDPADEEWERLPAEAKRRQALDVFTDAAKIAADETAELTTRQSALSDAAAALSVMRGLGTEAGAVAYPDLEAEYDDVEALFNQEVRTEHSATEEPKNEEPR